ncbi:RNA polymerase sigma-70 factor, ECF subfamily [Pedobacter westerhofensis]|uniref:RNA polymerase sigma-70 factor, ECF subfamily n=1 Tax=Pedobacter westerhofensis TaxID=425512 RepID=A0A521ESW8_9SPHI|nr:RNA polymerase sigma-70 factor, ECF subfamily [Pedobacter westerhofensis]
MVDITNFDFFALLLLLFIKLGSQYTCTLKNKKENFSELWNLVSIHDDKKAFESIFYLLNEPLIQFCMMYIHQTEAAEDIVSEVFFKCWTNRRSLSEIQSLDTYLFVAVKNQSLNYIKKFSHIHLVQIDDSNEFELVNTYNPQEALENKELMFKLQQAIDMLPQQCQIIFRLIKEEDLRYKEVAEILNLSPKTVKNQLYRAMKKLNLVLTEHSVPASKFNEALLNLLFLFSFLKIFH